MSEAVVDPKVESVLARFDQVMDELITLPVHTLSDDDLLALLRRLETTKRRQPVIDHRVIREVTTRELDFTHGAKTMTDFLTQFLRITGGEAGARVRAAEAAGTRTALSGEPLPPIFEHVATAQQAGSISPDHARVIVHTIDKLPGAVADLGVTVESLLVERARELDPTQLATHAQDLLRVLDPNGRLTEARDRERRRELRVHRRDDGSVSGTFEGTAEFGEHLFTVLDTLARPKPEAGGMRDQRSYPQRCHDAVLDLMLIAERSQQLPDAGGITTTIILTFDADDYANGTGVAKTGHGVTVATEEAKKWAGDARIIGVVFNKLQAITEYSTTQRFFTENQRLVMATRDGGCAFPGCDAPPQLCQAHHIIEYQHGGETSTNNGCLLCSFHHRTFEDLGWSGLMLHGRPHFVPPRWLDRDQTPKRNTVHDFGALRPDST